MNPPFGGKEGKEAQTRFAYKTGATQVLFLQHVIDSLKSGGRCGIVLDEGVLFRTSETAFVQTKRKLLDEYDDHSQVKVGKKTPLTWAHFEERLRLLPERAGSERSWTVTRADIEAKGNDLKLRRAAAPAATAVAAGRPARPGWSRRSPCAGRGSP